MPESNYSASDRAVFVDLDNDTTVYHARIMPLGDSITFGETASGTDGGYRSRLETLLGNAGVSVDFVGTRNDGPGDNDHEGTPGHTLNQINSGVISDLNNNPPDAAAISSTSR